MGNREEKIRISTIISESVRNTPRAVCGYVRRYRLLYNPCRGAWRNRACDGDHPDSFGYLQKNIAANGVESLVAPELGDCRECLSGVYDHILMGHFDALMFLPDACAHVRRGTIMACAYHRRPVGCHLLHLWRGGPLHKDYPIPGQKNMHRASGTWCMMW